MPARISGRPESAEFPAWANRYVDLVSGDDIEASLREQLELLSQLLKPVNDRAASEFAYEPGKWTIKQILGHVSDAERIFGYRLLRIARGDTTPLPGFEQDDYVATAASNDRPLSDLLDEFLAVRQASLKLLHGLTPEAWARTGTANGSAFSARAIAFLMAGHERHHANIIRDRYLQTVAA